MNKLESVQGDKKDINSALKETVDETLKRMLSTPPQNQKPKKEAKKSDK